MNIKHLTHRFLAPAGDDGSPDSIDRGDALSTQDPVVDVPESTADQPEPEKTEPEAQPRGEDGKFVKKEGKGIIPLNRHEAVLNKERLAREAAEQRAAELEKQIRKVDMTESAKELDAKIEALEEQLESARLDGDKEKALELARSIRKLEREAAQAAQADVGAQARDQAREEMRLDLTIEKLETQYPVLRDGAEEYDQDVVDLVLATQRDLIGRMRLTPSRALEAAVDKVMAKITPTKTEEKAAGLGAAKDVGSDRKNAQVAKNIDAATRQPANLKEVGLDGDKLGQKADIADASVMTFEEFNALPEATKAKMRGDLVN